MVLDPESNLIEILPQPVILKPNAGIGIGLRCCLIDQWFDRLEFMADPRQRLPLTVRIGGGKLNRQCSAKQSYDK